jgi:deoxyribonuclease-4
MRVTEVIKKLSYDKLVKDNIIPDLLSLLTVESRKYPPFVYKNQSFSLFGMLMDYFVRKGLRTLPDSTIDLGLDPLLELMNDISETDAIQCAIDLELYQQDDTSLNKCVTAIHRMVQLMYPRDLHFCDKDIVGFIPRLNNIIKGLRDQWIKKNVDRNISYNVEYEYENISGHPDIVNTNTILDIKNTCSFKTMGKSACLQIMAYYALYIAQHGNEDKKESKKSKDNVEENKIYRIGFVLPMQSKIKVFNVKAWDPSNYLHALLEVSNNNSLDNDLVLLVFDGCQIATRKGQDLFVRYNIGSHVSKKKNIAACLAHWAINNKSIVNNRVAPMQMFLRAKLSGKQDKATESFLKDASDVVNKTKLKYFTHAPYVINLCAGEEDKQDLLNEDLRQTAIMNGKGVVIHLGNLCGRSEKRGLKTMEMMIRSALKYATESCKLLLETGCGISGIVEELLVGNTTSKSTEVCCKLEDLRDFFLRFNDDERKKLGICLDTAHVHAAGYNPIKFLEKWYKNCLVNVEFVHFNDSKACCGSHRDAHEYPGRGKIGYDIMSEVAAFCDRRNIPMVFE